MLADAYMPHEPSYYYGGSSSYDVKYFIIALVLCVVLVVLIVIFSVLIIKRKNKMRELHNSFEAQKSSGGTDMEN